jgi:hypothetical protein
MRCGSCRSRQAGPDGGPGRIPYRHSVRFTREKYIDRLTFGQIERQMFVQLYYNPYFGAGSGRLIP